MADDGSTKVIRIVVDSSRAVDGSSAATRALAELERQTATMASGFTKMEERLNAVASLVKTQLVLALAQLAERVLAFGRESLKAAGDLEELAEQLGITTKGLQALQFAGVQNGLGMEALEKGVAKFSQKIGEAAGGSKQMIDALNELGVKILDSHGNLRSTETIMTEVAQAILKIEDPAKRTAAQVDFFSKSGARFAPVLREIADGFNQMGEKATKAGAVISDDAIRKLDALNDSAARSSLKIRALFAETAAPIATAALDAVNRVLEAIAKNLSWLMDMAKGYARQEGASGVREFQLDPMTKKYDAALGSYEFETRRLSSMQESQQRNPTARGAQNIEEQRAKARAAYDKLATIGVARYNAAGDYINRLVGSPDAPPALTDKETGFVPKPEPGVSNPTDKATGEGIAERMAKLRRDTARDLASAGATADASANGARAVADLEMHYKALKAAQEVYGKTAEENAGQVNKLTDEIEKQIKATERLKQLGTFNLETEGLEKANQILEAENRLINASTEERSKEIALIKLKQEVEAKGLDESDPKERAAIERRRAAIEQNETLKSQGEQLRKVNELWTEPLKRALQDIQSTAAGAFETMLEKGEFSAQALGDVFKKTVRRMIAEFLALATVRPVMSVVVQGLNNIGLVSNGMAQQLGFPVANTAGSAGGLGSPGGFSLPQMPGGGSLSSLSGSGFLGSFGDWLNTPFIGQSYGGAGSYASIDALLSSGAPGLTPLGAIGGIASMGLGAYSLFSGNGSTGSVIGGVSGILGGGLGMAAALIPGMAALGPIGMGIGLVGGLLGGLFGGGAPQIPPQPSLNLGIGSFLPNGKGGFGASGYGLNGGGSLAEQAGGLGTAVSTLFRQAGLKGVPGQMVGGRIWSGVDHPWNGGGWGNRPYTQAALVNPGADDGGGEYITYNDSSRTLEQVSKMLIAAVFKANVFRGGVTGASNSLRAGLSGYDPQSGEEVQKVISLSQAYDKLGKAVNPVKDAIDKLSSSFDELRDFADKASLSMQPIDDELKKQTKRTAQDFIDTMLDPLAVQLRALDDERKTALESAQYIKDNITDVYVDMDRIAVYYTNKEAALRDQFYQGGVSNLQALIKRLTYGDLANASPDLSMAGTRATYTGLLAQAQSGNANAIAGLSSAAEAYATSARSYFASSPEYDAIVKAIRQNLEQIVAAQTGGAVGADGSPVSANATSQAVLAANEQLREMVTQLANDNRDLKDQMSTLIAQLRSQNTNRM